MFKTILSLLRRLCFRLLLTAFIALATGSTVALFLFLLEKATHYRLAHTYLLFLLPVAGMAIYYSYKYWGKNSAKGNNLIIEEIRQSGKGIPFIMAPLVLVTTLVTHLFGGSAGREGTAVQIGGSLADQFCRWAGLPQEERKILLTAGIAAGFSAVFGTPVTGFVFALEVLVIGRLQYNAIIPCLLAAFVGNAVCQAWGIHHAQYIIQSYPLLANNGLVFVKTALAAVGFGLAAYIFSESLWRVKWLFQKTIKKQVWIPFAGGVIIILLSYLIGPDYLGLGAQANPPATSLASAFQPGGAHTWSWLWKILFTAITLSSGFKGGEVTPLFFIGATLGNTLAGWLHLPVDLLAGIGFIAVFAGATNTPLACTIMGVELFGGEYILYFAVACFIAYLISGRTGIYTSQLVGGPKAFSGEPQNGTTLEQYQKQKRYREARKWVKIRRQYPLKYINGHKNREKK